MPTECIADLHIHPDKNIDLRAGNLPHGENPRSIAQRILTNRLNIAALTPHKQVTTAVFDVNNEIEAFLATPEFSLHQRPEVLFGTEVNISFDNKNYHVGIVFNGNFTKYNLPKLSNTRSIPLEELAQIKNDHDCILFVAHPFWNDHDQTDLRRTRTLINSHYIDAYERINGAAFYNILTNQGEKLAKQNRHFRKTYNSLVLGEAIRRSIIKPALGNSDAHREAVIGTTYTTFMGTHETIAHDLFMAIKSGKTIAELNTAHPNYTQLADALQKIRNKANKLKTA